MKSLGKGSFLEKEHLQKLRRGIPVVTHFHSLTEALMWKFIIKELWWRCPLNYWRKGRSAWRSSLFNDRWFDKEPVLCIALNSLAKSERRMTGTSNSVEDWNVAGMGFHVKGIVYDNHEIATFLPSASCCDQMGEQFLTCRFQKNISRST